MAEAEVVVSIKGKRDPTLQRNLKRSRKEVKTFVDQSVKTFNKLKFAIAGAFSVGIIKQALGLFLKTADAIDQIAKKARALGVDVEALQALQKQGALAGVSVDKLNDSMKDLTIRSGLALTGNKLLIQSFANVGISVDDLRKKKPNQIFEQLADGLKGIPGQAEKVATAQTLIGESAIATINLLSEGGAKIKKFREDLQAGGALFSEKDANRVEKFNDALTGLKEIVGKKLKDFVIDVTPTAIAVVEDLGALLKASAAVVDAFNRARGFSATAGAAAAEAFDIVFQRRAIQEGKDIIEGKRRAKAAEGLRDIRGLTATPLQRLGDRVTAEVKSSEARRKAREFLAKPTPLTFGQRGRGGAFEAAVPRGEFLVPRPVDPLEALRSEFVGKVPSIVTRGPAIAAGGQGQVVDLLKKMLEQDRVGYEDIVDSGGLQ